MRAIQYKGLPINQTPRRIIMQLLQCTRKQFTRASALLVVFAAYGLSLASAFAATVTTDRADYQPGETVLITGSGFQADEPVMVQVLHLGEGFDNSTSPAHQPWDVLADFDGSFWTFWVVP